MRIDILTESYKCDACGKVYKENKIMGRKFKTRSIGHINIRTVNGRVDESYRLCDECLEKIYNVLNTEPNRSKED